MESNPLGPLWKSEIPPGSTYLSWVKIPRRNSPGPKLPHHLEAHGPRTSQPYPPRSPGALPPHLPAPGGAAPSIPRAVTSHFLHHASSPSTPPCAPPFYRAAPPELPLFRILVGVPSQPPPPQLGVLRQRVLDNSPPPLLVLPPAGAPRAGWNLSCSRRHPPIRCARISSVEVLGKRLEPYRSVQLSN
jgi:hypothetical protein